MTEEDVEAVLQTIVDLAGSIGWTVALQHNKSNELVGMIVGSPEWIERVSGKPQNPKDIQ